MESLMFSSHHKLDNLIIILDYNKIQSDDFNKNIMNFEPLKKAQFIWHERSRN